MSDDGLVPIVLDYLAKVGIMAWRTQSGALRHGKIKLAKKGTSDIIGCLPDGHFLAIECKAKKGKPNKDQIDFLCNIKKFGGVSILAYSLDDVIGGLNAR